MHNEITRVILVEDHGLMRALLRRLIRQVDSCHIVAEATDGEKAIEVIRSKEADLVILDLTLPRLSGMSVLEESKKTTAAKILATTVHSDMDLLQRALQAGADGIFLKGSGLEELKQAITDILDGKCPMCLENGCATFDNPVEAFCAPAILKLDFPFYASSEVN